MSSSDWKLVTAMRVAAMASAHGIPWRSERRAATAEPAEPAPTTTKSYSVAGWDDAEDAAWRA